MYLSSQAWERHEECPGLQWRRGGVRGGTEIVNQNFGSGEEAGSILHKSTLLTFRFQPEPLLQEPKLSYSINSGELATPIDRQGCKREI